MPLACPLTTRSSAGALLPSFDPRRCPRHTFDHSLIELISHVQSPFLTAVFVLLSAWWVKGPLLIAVGLGADVVRRRLPIAALAATVATISADFVSGFTKELVDRDRPPVADPDLGSLVPVPDSASFPSGHSATAFAAATAVAILCPKLRLPALALAAAVAISRVYLLVHYPLDVLAGAVLGVGLGALIAWAILRARTGIAPQTA